LVRFTFEQLGEFYFVMQQRLYKTLKDIVVGFFTQYIFNRPVETDYLIQLVEKDELQAANA